MFSCPTHNWTHIVRECPICFPIWMTTSSSTGAPPQEIEVLRAENRRLREALEKIKDGGVPVGVMANVTERMLAMCEIATEALLTK